MDLLNQVVKVTTSFSDFIWPIFLPLLVFASIYITYVTFKHIKPTIEDKEKMTFKQMMGPASISLGSKIGTGAIIGVLGSLSKLSSSGQLFIESVVLWGVIGAALMIPLTYSETLIARNLDQSPVTYIAKTISTGAAKFYSLALVILYVFGFGGFQFSGIDTVMTISIDKLSGINITEIQRYLFIIIPVILVTSVIILTKKHNVFINAMSSFIGFTVILYFVFFIIFVFRTSEYIPEFLSRMWIGFTNPVSMGIGVPTGLILGFQRILQTSEAGLGTSPLASEEGKEMGAHNSAMAQVIPTAVTLAVSIIITSYITSYGVSNNIIVLPSSGLERLQGFFGTAEMVTGFFGIIVLSVFALLSGITTLLGSYFFLAQLLTKLNENKRIIYYMLIIFISGTLAVFGFEIIFDIVDILLFVVSGLNVFALAVLVTKILKKKVVSKVNNESLTLKSKE